MQSEPFSMTREQAIIEDPEDRAAFLRYAQWLQEQGSPRGELARVQLALEEAPTDTLRERERALLAVHGAQLTSCRVTYRGGFLRRVTFAGSADALGQLLSHPSARLLHTLAIGFKGDEEEDFSPLVRVLASHHAPALRELHLGGMPEPDGTASFGVRDCGSLAALASCCPRLLVLRLRCPYFVLPTHPALRVLDVRMGASGAAVRSLAAASLPSLEELHLGYESTRKKPLDQLLETLRWDDEAVDTLGTASGLPALRRLCLWPTPFKRRCPTAARVAASPLGKRVAHLEVCDWQAPPEPTEDG